MNPADEKHADSQPTTETDGQGRRPFLVRAAAAVIGAIAGIVPLASGLVVFFDPLRRQSDSKKVRVATLDSVPDDGMPRQFPVVATVQMQFNTYPNEPIGSVFLRRKKGTNEVTALNAVCPHAGCFVDFNSSENQFQCPCHESNFQPDGERINPHQCPSPRDLDELEVDAEKLQEGDVWVVFKNFRSGIPEKIEE